MSHSPKYIADLKELVETVTNMREHKRCVVLAKGTYDVLHVGHADFLKRAKALGDILVVCVSSDRIVKRKKGASRPVNSELSRARSVAALPCVDYAFVSDWDSVLDLVTIVQPDVFATTNLALASTLQKANHLTKVVVLPRTQGVSTTDLLRQPPRILHSR